MADQTVVRRLIDAALAQVGAAYVWGAWGQPCTPEYRRKLAGYTPLKCDLIYENCQVLFRKQNSCAGCKYEGRLAFDCRGLTHYLLKARGIIALTGQGANSQYLTAANWVSRGVIGAMPDLPGMVLFRRKSGKMQHTGLYIGGGQVVEAKGHACGVVLSAMPGGWTHWGAPKGLYTARELEDAQKSNTQSAKGSDTNMLKTIKRGSTGDAVTELQTRLTALGTLVTIDGKYGPQTCNAVIAYQQANNLTPDGVVGPLTWAALGVTEALEAPQDADAGGGEQNNEDKPDKDLAQDAPAAEVAPVTRAEFDALCADVAALKALITAHDSAADI